MILRRKLASNGQVGISRKIRCPALEHEAAVCVRAGAIMLVPRGAPLPDGFLLYEYRKFDSYNRITMAPEVMTDSGISGNLEIRPQGDGTLLLLPAAGHSCIICGSGLNLNGVNGHYLCDHCIRAAQLSRKHK